MSAARYFTGVLSVALLAASFAAASDAKVQKVLVRGSGQAIEVEIQTSGASVSPNTQAITGPDRIVVDFPGALPSSELHALHVNQGLLKSVRTGLFSSNPPTTRIVLDLAAAQTYQVSTSQNAVVVKLGSGGAPQAAAAHAQPQTGNAPVASARLQNAALVSGPAIPSASISIERVPVTRSFAAASNPASGRLAMIANASQPKAVQANPAQAALPVPSTQPNAQAVSQPVVQVQPPQPPQPSVSVSYQNGLLSIQSDKASLSQVLFEVHMKTQADIAIPAGAEQEQVVANLGPAPAKDVLSALLNGSTYNFIFMGDEKTLERVIISKKDPNLF